MKRLSYTLVLVGLLVIGRGALSNVRPAAAQGDPNLITLNDATPGIDVVISFPPDTTGAVALELSGAAASVTDSAGNVVFQVADARVHALELHFAPNSGSHTLSVQRLTGIVEGYVKVTPQSDMTLDTGLLLVSGEVVTPGQEIDAALNATTPNSTMSVSLPVGTPGTITASFPGAPVTAQLVDSAGVAVATLYAGQIDGLRVSIDGGDYQVVMLNTDPQQNTVAAVSAVPSNPSSLPVAAATSTVPSTTDTVAQTTTQSAPEPTQQAAVAVAEACTVTIDVSSVNLRSGPGTGYSVLDYGFRNQQFAVGGINSEQNWLLVGTDDGSAWMDATLGTLAGGCNNLTVYNIPFRSASVPQLAVQQPATGGGEFEREDEHEGGEGREGEDD